MDRSDLFYWAVGTGGLWLLHYLHNQGRIGQATADTLGDVAEMVPRIENPVLRLAARRCAEMAERVVVPPIVAGRFQPPEGTSKVTDAEFTILEE